MNKSMLTGVAVGVAVAAGGGALAMYSQADKEPLVAQVLDVKEVTKTISSPRQQCENVVRTIKKPVKDENRVTGSVIGAVVGGVLGNQVGGGSGKKLATVAGAAAGGYAGNQVQKDMQNSDVTQITERQCHTVYDKSEKLMGYDVTYQLGEQTSTVRMDQKPGKTLPVENGQVVLSAQQG